MSVREYRYYGQRREDCNMNPKSVALIKGMFYSILMGIPVVIGLLEAGGNTTFMVLGYIVAVLLVIGIEIEHIKVGDAFFIQFNGNDDEE